METFEPGELVALTEAPVDTRGRVVAVSEDGAAVIVRWELHQERAATTEDAVALRRVHESEEGMTAA